MTESNERRPLIAGNWKMHGSMSESRKLVAALCEGVAAATHADMLLCPPYVYLSPAAQWLAGSPIALGGQDLSEREGAGAYTGDVSGQMLADVGCSHVVVGHSERRQLHGESDAVVAAKFAAARSAGLAPVFCVGETLEEREADDTAGVIERQVGAVLEAQGAPAFEGAVIAYEPVWAIGTGKTATPEQAQEVHSLIRAMIAARDVTIARNLTILYGGSMKAANARELLTMPDIDGGLVGGASLKATEFLAIFEAASD